MAEQLNMEDERAAFEAHSKAEGAYNLAPARHDGTDELGRLRSTYYYAPTETAWRTWKVARRSAPVSAPMGQELPPPHWAKTQSYSAEQVQSIIAPYAERICLLTQNLEMEREYVSRARKKTAEQSERIRHLERELATHIDGRTAGALKGGA
jgi:hypothetical protein